MGEIIEENVIGVKVKFMGEIESRNSFNDDATQRVKRIIQFQSSNQNRNIIQLIF